MQLADGDAASSTPRTAAILSPNDCVTNVIITSKYTAGNFLVKALLELLHPTKK